MPWRDTVEPTPMARVAVVAPILRVREVLCAVADAGAVEVERDPGVVPGPARLAWERARRDLLVATPAAGAAPALRPGPTEADALAAAGDLSGLAGEAELEAVRQSSVEDAAVTAFAGWVPAAGVEALERRVVAAGGAVAVLPAPRGVQPPTLLAPSPAEAFQPLVDTYATVPYRDVNPSLLAGVVYVVMFGMMFGDVGHGAILTAAGAALCWSRSGRLARLRWSGPFVLGAGLASIGFGFAYGELFGPTGAVPTLWLAPLDHPTTLLAVAVGIGVVLLLVSFLLGTVNRWREGGPARALLSLSGLAGAATYVGLGLVLVGWYRHTGAVLVVGAVTASLGLALGSLGLFAEAGGHAGGAAQAGVGMFDGVVRLGTNTVSFARLAAFGLTHAALTAEAWKATLALGHHGGAMWIVAGLVFVVANAFAFALEGLVAGIQALRLEYYEMFSRIFAAEGRRFRPWHVPIRPAKEASCLPG